MISGRASSARSAGGDTSPYRSAAGPRERANESDQRGGHHPDRQPSPPASSGATRVPRFPIKPPPILSAPVVGCDPADDACRHDALGHRRGARQRVGTAAGETDDGHLVDAERVGDGAQVVGELEDVLRTGAASMTRSRAGRCRSAGCPPLPHRPWPRWGSACARRGCRAARRWSGPAVRRTRRTRSADPRRRRCFLRASGDRLRQPCPECRMPAVTSCPASGLHGASWRHGR